MLTFEAAEIAADSLRRDMEIPIQAIDPFQIAQKLNIGVALSGPEEVSYTLKLHDRYPCIVVSEKLTPVERRLMVSHGLGHVKEREVTDFSHRYSFECHSPDRIEKGQSVHEYFAHVFSMALLMPRWQFNLMVEKGMKTQEIADFFGVRRVDALYRKRLIENFNKTLLSKTLGIDGE
ncbi:ImmA/IrrE family metallo-endopeptidase [Actinomyces vulturis]|uniref:ImmA/IrrE family metallo-endopeptidase n=1 Tax=Actinomyces vulturis TaxID=1857645 RepID=UPI00082D6C78|nr:ImmA/IrrE family metallo-endopeptidase [Actinomyces vulturis]